MPTFRVQVSCTHVETFYVDAESKEEVEEFMQAAAGGEWFPGDVDGLVDDVVELDEHFTVSESKMLAMFALVDGEIVEQE